MSKVVVKKALSGLLRFTLNISGSISGSIYYCDFGSLWLTLALSGSFWLTLAVSEALIGSQGPCWARCVVTGISLSSPDQEEEKDDTDDGSDEICDDGDDAGRRIILFPPLIFGCGKLQDDKEGKCLLSPSGDLGIGLVWDNHPHRSFLVPLLKSSSNWTKSSMMGPQLFLGWYQMILDVQTRFRLGSD